MSDDPPPWARNEGKFDRPSSGIPRPPERETAPAPVRDDPRAYHGVEPVRPIAELADALVEAFGPDGARAVVEAVRDAPAAKPERLAEVAGPEEISADRLRQIVERVEALFAQRDELADDIRQVFSFAKSIGFDPKCIRAVVKMRALDKTVRLEGEALLDVYRHALGIEGPDFVVTLPPPSVPPPPPARRLTAKEKQYRDALALTAAARASEA